MSSHQRPADQRAALCDALASVPPTAPTLCEGWTAHHLAAHVWVRENETFRVAGNLLTRKSERTDDRLAELVARRPYADLVEAIRRGPAGGSPFRLPGVEQVANTLEFFVHCEDVRRGGGDLTPRPRDLAMENEAWKASAILARRAFRTCPVAVWLERDAPAGDPVRIGRGPDIVTVVGAPTELLLYLSGRRGAARVELVGEPASVSLVERVSLGF
ncbi:MAG: TIGR03085 family metal-binding protein [Propionicimonas sp.]|uniref:TIGR03085 family metal-binding protein n=1 Tax=Propionicimonas sp. TaxID=1955623 RepID=UPI003D0AC79C